MRQDKKKNNKPAAALVLCFCLIAIVSVMVVSNSIDKVKSSMETADVVKKQAVDEIQETDESTPIVDSRENSDGSADESRKAADYIFPVEGEVIMDHSIDMPVYWKTLDQYMTHSGIDIASETGTPVQACADGTVTKIEEDTAMGVTVEINHGNGLISVYSNLAANGLIELGEVICQGTVIGMVGNSAMFEFDCPDHLHFEMIKGDEPVDPAKYLK